MWQLFTQPSYVLTAHACNDGIICGYIIYDQLATVSTFKPLITVTVLPLWFPPWCDSISDNITYIPSSRALRKLLTMRQARKWAVICGWYSSCVCECDGHANMCAISSLLQDWQHLHVRLRSLLNLRVWVSVYHRLLKLLHARAWDSAVDVNDLEAMW